MAFQQSGPERLPAAAAGITEEMICTVVHGFYQRVRGDVVLGPIFANAIADDRWPQHLEKMVTFWGSVLLMTGAYHGRPVPAHVRLPIERQHFQHWLGLFAETARELCPPAAAALFLDRAERIANSLMMACAVARRPTAGEGPIVPALESIGRQP